MPKRPPQFKPIRASTPKLRDVAHEERRKFYNTRTWRRLREQVLNDRPACVDCEAEGRTTEAVIAHHDQERLRRPDLALDADNLIPLCAEHHNRRHKAGGASRA